MKKKMIITAAALAVIGLISTAAFALDGPPAQGRGMGRGMGRGFGPGWNQAPQGQQGACPAGGSCPWVQSDPGTPGQPPMAPRQGFGPNFQGGQGPRGQHRGMMGQGMGRMGQGFGPGEARGQMGRGMGRRGMAMGPQGPGEGLRHLLMQLDLTDEQKEQIKTLHEENQQAIQDARQAVEDARQALQQTAREDSAEEAIRAAATELGNAIGDQAVTMAQLHQSVLNVLTDEQKTQLETLKEEAKTRMEERRNRMQQRFEQPEDADGDPLLPAPRGRGGFRGRGR